MVRIFSNIFLHGIFVRPPYLQRRRLTSSFTDVDTVVARA